MGEILMANDLPPLPEGFSIVEEAEKLPPVPEGFGKLKEQSEKPSFENLPEDTMGSRTAAFLRGVREGIPFARDVGAGAEYLRKNITGDKTSFSEEKRRQQERDAALSEQHPYLYGTGEVAGTLGSMAIPGAAGVNLLGKGAAAEALVANKLAPKLGSEAAAKLVTGLGSGATVGAAQSALHGLGTGTSLEERLGQAGEEAVPGAIFGAAGAGLGHAVARGARSIGEKLGYVAPLTKDLTSEELLKLGRDAYKKTDSFNAKINAEPIRGLYDDILGALKKEGYTYDKDIHKELKPVFKKLKSIDEPQTISDLDQIMKMTTPAIKNYNNPTERTMAGIVRRKMNDFLDKLTVDHMVDYSGDPVKAVESLKEGRKFWKVGRKTEEIADMIEEAQHQASKSGIGSNYNNALRQRADALYKRAKEQPQLWTKDELKALKDLTEGDVLTNVARFFGRFSPVHHPLHGMIEASLATHSPTVGFPAMAAAYGAHKVEDYLTGQAKQNLERIVAAGGKKPATSIINPAESFMSRSATVPATTSFLAPKAPVPLPIAADDREERAAGGRLGKGTYPAKRLSRMEKAVIRAQKAIAAETKPIMDQPDHVVARALEIAMNK